MHVKITKAISVVPPLTLLSHSHSLAMPRILIFLVFFGKFEPRIFLFYHYHSVSEQVSLFLTLTASQFFKIVELKGEVI